MKNQRPLDMTSEWETIVDKNHKAYARKRDRKADKIYRLLLADVLLGAGLIVLWVLGRVTCVDKVTCMIISDCLAIPACLISGYLLGVSRDMR